MGETIINHTMGSKFTFELPDELKATMDEHPEVNWSAVFRNAARRQAEAIELVEEILDEQADPRVQAVAKGLEEGMAKRFRDSLASNEA